MKDHQLFSEALTYDDVLIEPNFSNILPHEVNLQGKFSANINLNLPFISAAMDTVTESRTAIVMAQQGGIGVIHKNLSAADQAEEVLKVKKFESSLIVDPMTIKSDLTIENVQKIINEKKISGLLVVDNERKLKGIITRRDLRFAAHGKLTVEEVMTKNVIARKMGISKEEVLAILKEHKIEKLPLVDDFGVVSGLMTIKDIENHKVYPSASKDDLGRLRVAAAIGVGDLEMERAFSLIGAGVDALIIDTAHGHSQGVKMMVETIKGKMKKENIKNVDIIAGNIATRRAAIDLIKWGVDGIKVGIGPGSICTTRVVAGIGVPQLSALIQCEAPCREAGIPYIADGGIKYSGDVVKALAAGAGSVMLGSMLAGTEETPGEKVLYQGRSFKVYRGMGSMGAMKDGKGARDRYSQGHLSSEEKDKLVPEGIEGRVPYRGTLGDVLYQLTGGLRSGMGYVGAANLEKLRENANFIKITSASLREGHPHDIIITKEAPNYSLMGN